MSITHKQLGFTVVELVTVMVLVAILAVAVVTRLPARAINLSAQAEQLAADIRYAQQFAMTRGCAPPCPPDMRYRINFLADRYWFSNQTNTATIAHPATNQNQVLLTSGVTLTTTHAFIVFDGYGAPYSDATSPGTALAADAVITLSASGETPRTVRISPQTGRVIVP